jgi:hypothetical protein
VSSSVTNCHLCFFWLLVCVCVRARACACVGLGLYAILVFPRFFVCCDLCSGCVIYCHLCFTGFKGLCVCVRPGRLLCCLKLILVWFVCGRVYFDLFRFYLLSITFNFVCSWDTRRWIKSKNKIRLILIHHRQNPTKMNKITALHDVANDNIKRNLNAISTNDEKCNVFFLWQYIQLVVCHDNKYWGIVDC